MPDREIKVWEVVRLNSGGARMSVIDLSGGSLGLSGKTVATCMWHDAQNQPQKEIYPVDMLKHAGDGLMANEEIKVGEVVRLDSGGASMSVIDLGGGALGLSGKTVATCMWHDAQNQPQKEIYPVDMLVHASKPRVTIPRN